WTATAHTPGRTCRRAATLSTQAGQESADAPQFLGRLAKLADGAGGEPPLPKDPDRTHLDDIANRVGNDQLRAIHDNRDRLAQEVADWGTRAKLIDHQSHPAVAESLYNL